MEKVGYMGIAGSFSEVAATKLLELAGMTDAELIPLVCSQNILEALRSGEVAYGVLGIRNTTAGPVAEFVNAFQDVEYTVLGEYILPIHHCLFKKPDIAQEALTEVASHPQAFAQTVRTRKARWPQLSEHEIEDTAIGAEFLAKGTLPDTTAVICSSKAGQLWGLDLIAENIEDSTENRTTFWLLRLTEQDS
ncbi:MAG: hypothetical protein LUC83_02105 [Clostridiales bacterium]|nr:hypothetical protein [Clostridiales bacterium]